MNLTLLSGRYSAADARKLLTELIRVKIAFHEGKIKTVHHDEEDIKHSERRIRDLQNGLREALAEIDRAGDRIDLNAVATLKALETA